MSGVRDSHDGCHLGALHLIPTLSIKVLSAQDTITTSPLTKPVDEGHSQVADRRAVQGAWVDYVGDGANVVLMPSGGRS